MEQKARKRVWGVVTGQGVSPEKKECARRLRQRMTRAERKFWNAKRRNSLRGLHFRRHQVIDGFVADFYCSEKRLVVELDGGVHAEQIEEDRLRDDVICHRGLTVVRFRNEDVQNRLEWVLSKIVEVSG